jgi:hypothetical protein
VSEARKRKIQNPPKPPDSFSVREGKEAIINRRKKESFKMVNLQILVPEGKFCCFFRAEDSYTCQFFDNEGGHPTCAMDLGSPELEGWGYVKPYACADLLKD